MDRLYQLRFDAAIEKMLTTGRASLMVDKTGMQLPVAKESGRIVGLPQLIPAQTADAARVLQPHFAAANMLSRVHNGYQLHHLRKAVDFGNKLTAGLGAANLLVTGVGMALNYAHHRETRRITREENDRTRAEMAHGFTEMKGTVVALASAQLEATAHLHEVVVEQGKATEAALRQITVDVRDGFSQLSELSALGVLVALDSQKKNGEAFADVLQEIFALRSDVRDLNALVKDLARRSERQDIGRALAQLRGVQQKLSTLDEYQRPEDEVRRTIEVLEDNVVPTLESHLDIAHDNPEARGLTLLFVDATQTAALARTMTEEPQVARRHLGDARGAVDSRMKRLLDGDEPGAVFIANTVPEVRVLQAINASLRLSELSLGADLDSTRAANQPDHVTPADGA